MKSLLFFCFSLMLISTNAQSPFPFDLEVSNQPYEALTEAIVLNDGVWDDPEFEIPLGFDFEFLGSTGSSLYISNLYLGGALGFYDELVNPQDLMILYGSDLIDAGYDLDSTISTISYAAVGDPGSRIVKIQWDDCAFYNELADFGTSTNRVSFQCWIYEADNSFEMRFGSNSVKSPELVHDEGGLWMAFVDDIDIFNNQIADSWFLSGAVLDPAVTHVNSINDITSLDTFEFDPYSGIVYRFSPLSTGVSESIEMDINIYPNPATDKLWIEGGYADQTSRISIFDLSGKVLVSEKVNGRKQELDVSHLSPGIYLLQLQQEDATLTRKFIVN